MTHDDAMKMIAAARAKVPTVTLTQFADALEAVMLERLDILATCGRKIDAANAERNNAKKEWDAERQRMQSDIDALGTTEQAQKIRDAREIDRLQAIFSDAGQKLQALRKSDEPTDAIKESK